MAAGDAPDTFSPSATTWTGSIGVIIPHFNVADLLESWKVKDDSIASGPFKELASPTRKVTPALAEQERKILQTMVDQTFDQFKEVVTEARPKLANNKEALAKATTGQVFTAKQCWHWDWSIAWASRKTPSIGRSKWQASTKRMCASSKTCARKRAGFRTVRFRIAKSVVNPTALLDLNTPRAYFLYTMLPALMTNQSH